MKRDFQPEPPERHWFLDRQGLSLHVCEWGDVAAPPLLLVHGALDSHASFSDLAPRLARSGWRAVSYDQRGHGDSDRSEHVGWMADVSDLLAVARHVGGGQAMPVIGHSKGGSLLNYAVLASPQTFSCFVNLDGLSFDPDTPGEAVYGDTLNALRSWTQANVKARAPRVDALEKLTAARQRANPRVSSEVVAYLTEQLTHEGTEGRRWKHDPLLPVKRVAPHSGHWLLNQMSLMTTPMLAIHAGVREGMAWPVRIESLQAALPDSCALEVWPETGHFIHLEAPQATADRIRRFIANFHHTESRAPVTALPAQRPPAAHGTTENAVPPATGRAVLLVLDDASVPHPAFDEAVEGFTSSWEEDVRRFELPSHGRDTQGGFVTMEGCLLALVRLAGHAERVAIIGRGRARLLALLAAATFADRASSLVFADPVTAEPALTTSEPPALWEDDNGVTHYILPDAWKDTLRTSIQASSCLIWRDLTHPEDFCGLHLPRMIDLTKSNDISRIFQ